MRIAKGAAFDSYENQHDECLPGTRTELLREIDQWAESPHGKCIFWLDGMAGTGKSTISRTVARRLKEKGLLGASFFFKRGEEDRGSAKKLFPTLTAQLVTSIPPLTPYIQKAIEDDPLISEKVLREQFERLLLQPLLGINQATTPTMVIVIDALDECERVEDVQAILRFLPQVQKSTPIRLRFLLTSRPELPIKLGLNDIAGEHQDFILHEIPEPVIEHDITLYFETKFAQLRQERSFPPDWPGDESIRILIERAVPLFIAAATVCRFIGDVNWNPRKRLQAILKDQSPYISKMGTTYLPVLKQLLVRQDKWETRELIEDFKKIVGAIIVLATPLSANALGRLLDKEPEDIRYRLARLHSVLNISDDLDAPVRLLHLSFRDFLLDSKTKEEAESEQFWIDEKAVHQTLTDRCLKVMQQCLRKNICNLPDDGTQRNEIDVYSINRHLPLELRYACRYWTHHLVRSRNPVTWMSQALSFLEEHFLHWVEAMSILGRTSEVLRIINSLASVMQVSFPEVSL